MKTMILFKAVKTKSASQSSLFDQADPVKGYTRKDGTFVAPHQAKHKHALKEAPTEKPVAKPETAPVTKPIIIQPAPASVAAPAPAPESLPINQSRQFSRRGGFARRAIYSVEQTIEATDPYENTKLYDIVRLTNDQSGRKKITYQLYPQDSQVSLITDAPSRERLLAHLPNISLTIKRQSAVAPDSVHQQPKTPAPTPNVVAQEKLAAYQQWVSTHKANSATRSAFTSYQMSEYAEINAALRAGRPAENRLTRSQTAVMDKAFKDLPGPMEIDVFRGAGKTLTAKLLRYVTTANVSSLNFTDNKKEETSKILTQNIKGVEFDDKAFLSTSKSKKNAFGFGNLGSKIKSVIHITGQAKGFYLNDITNYEEGVDPAESEQEILLDRGHSFKITHVTVESGSLVFHAVVNHPKLLIKSSRFTWAVGDIELRHPKPAARPSASKFVWNAGDVEFKNP